MDKKQIKKKLAEIEEQIREQNVRIPPHSVQPHHIEELERLEEERDRLKELL